MPSPSSSLSTLRPDLASSFLEFDLAMDRQGFIAPRVLPVVDVASQSGKYGKIPIESLLANRTTDRSPGGGYSRSSFTFTDASYACDEHGAEEPVDDRAAKMYRNYFDAEVIASQRAYDVVLRNQEKRVAALIFNTSTWTGSSLTTAVSTPWSTIASAVPMTDVEAAVRKVWDGTGIWPNALVLSRKRFRDLRRCAQITDLLKYNGLFDVNPGNITAQAIAQVLDLDFVIVAGSAKNTANEGQSASISSVWSDTQAMVCRVATTSDPSEPCLGRIFHWGEDGSEVGGTVETYRDESIRSDVVRVRHDVDEVVMYTEMGHLLTSVG